MAKSTARLQEVMLDFIRRNEGCSSGEIFEGIGAQASYATVKRVLQSMLAGRLIEANGRGKGTRYRISPASQLLMPVDVERYFQKEIDEREIVDTFNHELIRDTLPAVALFTEEEQATLDELQRVFEKNTAGLSAEEYKREFERLAIDLSWKSSQIEGNTYSLLETERLLKEKETAAGKTRDEATMLLNHKEALDFILEQPGYIHPLSVARIEDIHSVLIKDLNVDRNIRHRRVGITGTNYRPLDNEYQIKEALEDMCALINQRPNVFEKALLALALISYIQPFADGNKRTARIISNAILIYHRHCPISFRTVDSIDYKKAMLIFYEQNNISAFKRIFVEQFAFAVGAYF